MQGVTMVLVARLHYLPLLFVAVAGYLAADFSSDEEAVSSDEEAVLGVHMPDRVLLASGAPALVKHRYT